MSEPQRAIVVGTPRDRLPESARLAAQAVVRRAMEDGPTHDYLSTACYHGLHERCRLVCKFCDEPCRCECHGGA